MSVLCSNAIIIFNNRNTAGANCNNGNGNDRSSTSKLVDIAVSAPAVLETFSPLPPSSYDDDDDDVDDDDDDDVDDDKDAVDNGSVFSARSVK